jgi:Family of unknown function (DUF5939)
MVNELNEKLLDERLAALESAHTWSPRVVSKLGNHMRSAEDAELFRINPCSFATEKGISEEEAVDLFLHATQLGLFEMDWFLICPLCSCVIDSFRDVGKSTTVFKQGREHVSCRERRINSDRQAAILPTRSCSQPTYCRIGLS